MILEEEQIKNRIDNLKRQIEVEKKIIEMAEPFEMLLENDYFKKIQGYYQKSVDIYQEKINGLNNDLVSDGAKEDIDGLPENPIFHQLRVANIIGKAVVARDTLLAFVVEPKQIVERAKSSQEKIEAINKEIADLEGGTPNA